MLQEIIDQLNAQKGKFRKISEETGLDYDWLHQVARGVIKNPGFEKIQTLKTYLDELEDASDSAA